MILEIPFHQLDNPLIGAETGYVDFWRLTHCLCKLMIIQTKDVIVTKVDGELHLDYLDVEIDWVGVALGFAVRDAVQLAFVEQYDELTVCEFGSDLTPD